MKTKHLLFAAACILSATGSHAQTSVVSIYTEDGEDVPESFSFDGGTFTITDNTVDIAFAGNEPQNRSYAFDELTAFSFATGTTTGIDAVRATPSTGNVDVYTVAGVRVTGDLSSLPAGVYIVRTGRTSRNLQILKSSNLQILKQLQ
ncbi:MAG: hypothetical protein LBK22_10100 [Tannerella sp.]|jgi:hypothetical protein|nr:hypothetical protein [Tannerella sp.]